MEIKESSIEVNYTTDYAMFKMIDGNRELNETKINRIIEDIEAGIDLLAYYPLLVYKRDDRLEILDGQHRFYISKKLRRPVHFIILKNHIEMYDIAKVNSNTEKWKPKNYIHCYVQFGNENYIALRDFIEEFGLSVSLSMKLLSTGLPSISGSSLLDFQRGNFKASHLNEAKILAKQAKAFDFLQSWKSSNFFSAIHKIVEADKVPILDVIEKCAKYSDQFQPQETAKDYVMMIEGVYNTRLKDRVYLT